MKLLTYTRVHNIARLYDDLVAAIPALAPTIGADGRKVARVLLSSNGDALTLNVPDDLDEALILPVLTAHDPTPPPVLPVPDYGADATPPDQLADVVRQLRAFLGVPSPSNAQVIGALKLLIRVVLYLGRRVL